MPHRGSMNVRGRIDLAGKWALLLSIIWTNPPMSSHSKDFVTRMLYGTLHGDFFQVLVRADRCFCTWSRTFHVHERRPYTPEARLMLLEERLTGLSLFMFLVHPDQDP